MPGEGHLRIVRNPQRDLGRGVGRNVKAREKAGAKARARLGGGGTRLVSSSKSGWLNDSYRKVHPLIGALQRHIVSENTRLQGERSYGYIHPSSACKADWCPRASWYEIMGTPALPAEGVGHRMANVFAEGHEIHDKYQRWFRQMGILIGMWECLSCGHVYWDQSPERCQFCLDNHLIYREVPVEDEDLMIRGSADGLVIFEERKRLIEIKSIGLRSIELDFPKMYRPYKDGEINLTQLWASVKEPFPVHIRQATLYLHVLRSNGDPVEDIIFIYEFKGNQDVKAFTIGYRPEAIEHILTGARQIAVAIDRQRPVRRPAWAEEPTNKVCRVCPYRETCWEGSE